MSIWEPELRSDLKKKHMVGLGRAGSFGVPYRLTHRENRSQEVFFDPRDREIYKDWLALYSREYGLQV